MKLWVTSIPCPRKISFVLLVTVQRCLKELGGGGGGGGEGGKIAEEQYDS